MFQRFNGEFLTSGDNVAEVEAMFVTPMRRGRLLTVHVFVLVREFGETWTND
jgi:hypothetical protein